MITNSYPQPRAPERAPQKPICERRNIPPPESRPYNFERDPWGLKALAQKYDVLFSEIALVAGVKSRGKVSSAFAGDPSARSRRVEVIALDALRARGATEAELAPALASGFGRSVRHRNGMRYKYRPVFADGAQENGSAR
jgi:hypothetical protein